MVTKSTENFDLNLLLNTLIAVKKGDFTARLPVDWTGISGKIADLMNELIERKQKITNEVEKAGNLIAKEGKMRQKISIGDVEGSWREMIENMNTVMNDLVTPTMEMTRVIRAVARGDLSQYMEVELEGKPLQGDFLSSAKLVNKMVEQLNFFSSEVTRVAREVGTEGKLGGQASVPGVAGTWKDLTDSVNSMASNLTGQVRNIAEVTIAVANGDLSKKITVDVRGEFLQLKETINTMVEQLRSFASEVTRVAKEVGTEGKLGVQGVVPGVAGTWKDLTDSVNSMAGNLTAQVRNIADVTTAVAKGDLSRKITVDAKGEILELKNTVNTMVDQLNAFASEVTRVAKEVGTEGKLGGQGVVPGVAGTWKDLTENVNSMAGNLTGQVRNIAEVTIAVANGDLTKKITADAKGEMLQLKETINTMVEQLRAFASEVTRVAREVGTDGKLGGQGVVPGVAGTWKDLTDSVNSMAGNLTGQVRNIADVTTAVAKGDLSKKITVDAKGEILELKNTINIMVDQLNAFASEVTRVAREVGTEGKLGVQGVVQGVAGTWKDLTESVNFMASNLTGQVRNIAEVTIAVANGDLTKKITVDARGEILELKDTINTMVEQLRSFASEVTRVAKEVGTEGKLGGQAVVPGVAGTWKDLTDNVNSMASNLTGQVRNIVEVTTAIATGDLSKKITVDVRGEFLQLKETINTMVVQLNAFASEVIRVAREVGTEGRLGGQAYVMGVGGTWKDLTDNVNWMAANLTGQVRNIAEITTAVANGDLSKKITVDVKGEILDLKITINTMVDQLSSFASEVTKVAREVGTEGKLGGQSYVKGVSGVWKELTDSVNLMAANLTNQVRSIAKVVTEVAKGNLRQKLTVEAKGEISTLTDTINEMIDTLAIFGDQVTSVAREVGVEGKLGGQAAVPGASGLWKDLTDNVNQLAANLSTQVRAIAEVATAVTKGDLSRSIKVEAKGEVAELKDNINEMIRNLRDTTQKNSEQDWLKTNLAKFTSMLQGQRDMVAMSKKLLSELAPLVNGHHGVVYVMDNTSKSEPFLKYLSSYAFKERKHLLTEFKVGEGLVGQCAYEKERILLTNVPSDYIQISSGLGEATPLNIIVMPILFEGQVRAVIELASFERFSQTHQAFLEQLMESIGIVINSIEATSRTEELLKKSQALAEELQSQQEELQQTNEELEGKARLLAEQKSEVEKKNREVEMSRIALEEKAQQLALTSKYKSEFLSNMSHELRTPLNSLLILSQQLAANADKNLSEHQVKCASSIISSGKDLLALINDILDLSKIESGTVTLDSGDIYFTELRDVTQTTFSHMAEDKGLNFNITLSPDLPSSIYTDEKRLNQIIKNLLSNAFKFTSHGKVDLHISVARDGWSREHEILKNAGKVISFSVKDTGIGISPDKQKIIFEAFQQADGSTSRRYGGTGLGLSISREIARLLGGEIKVKSREGEGSVFTLYLPSGHSGHTQDIHKFNESGIVKKSAEKPLYGKDNTIKDDRDNIKRGDKILLIVEDDITFGELLLNTAHKYGFKGIISTKGEIVTTLAKEYKPHAITLDIILPDIDGWTVLDRLKLDPTTRHIPVHIISISETDLHHSMQKGVVSYLSKPVNIEELDEEFNKINGFIEKKERNLLLVESDVSEKKAIIELIGNGNINITALSSGQETLSVLKKKHFDCMILDMNLPDMTGFELMEEIKKIPEAASLPIILYKTKSLTKSEEKKLEKLSKNIILKEVHSPERLLDETSLFLHRTVSDFPEYKRKMLHKIYNTDLVLKGKKLLIVDDDMRNIFAITSVLERHDMEIFTAENGKVAIEILKKNPHMDIVLMDVMMPEMDGYEAMEFIRKSYRFKSLPIIALTAKAMKGDREKCIEAGASDYITKPVDTEQLLSLLRVWLYR